MRDFITALTEGALGILVSQVDRGVRRKRRDQETTFWSGSYSAARDGYISHWRGFWVGMVSGLEKSALDAGSAPFHHVHHFIERDLRSVAPRGLQERAVGG